MKSGTNEVEVTLTSLNMLIDKANRVYDKILDEGLVEYYPVALQALREIRETILVVEKMNVMNAKADLYRLPLSSDVLSILNKVKGIPDGTDE